MRLACTAGRGREAKYPKRVGWRFLRSAAKALVFRVRSMARASSSGMRWVPGEEMERIDLVMLR